MRIARGQTLIELLAAFAIIASGLMAVMGLVISNRTLSQANADRLVATNLAREGLELVREMRDSNWLAGQYLNQGDLGGVEGTATPVWSGAAGQSAPHLDYAANDFTHDNTNVVIVSPATGLFANKNAGAAITGTATMFRRLITLTALCDDGSGSYPAATPEGTTSCPGAQPQVGLRVRSETQWTHNNGQSGTAVMYNDLYDWR